MKDVTVGDMIAYLERLPKDTKVRLSVGDYYSRYGEEATFMDFSMEGGIWNHFYNDAGWITLKANLNTQKPYYDGDVEKHPKITFRKA